jgi:hypothetical protein
MSEPNGFIDSQCTSELDAAVAAEYRDAAAAVGRPFVPVYLRLSREENIGGLLRHRGLNRGLESSLMRACCCRSVIVAICSS